jgi:hypothetical protein
MTPYVIATALACGAMAWYFFIFVPSKLEYFTGLRFRTMAVAAGQVRSKIESLQVALELAREGVRPQEALPKAATATITPLQREQVRTYLALLVPQIRLEESPSASGFVVSVPDLMGTCCMGEHR